MAYVSPNFRTKKELRNALKQQQQQEAEGKVVLFRVRVFQPGLGTIPQDGEIDLEGPHYPEPHRWYATGVMRNGRLIRIK